MSKATDLALGYPPTPELDRMKAVVDDSRKLGQFLDWMDETKIVLATHHEHQGSDGEDDAKPSGCWEPHACRPYCGCRAPHPHRAGISGCTCHEISDKLCGYADGQLVTITTSKEAFLAKYFEIDLKKIDREKQAILDWVQKTPAERKAMARAVKK